MEQPTSSPIPLQHVATLRKNTRRARAACELCRFKKVRCDAREGHPCPNCIYENVHCVQPPRRPRKIRRRSSGIHLAGKLWSIETDIIPQHQDQQSPLQNDIVIPATQLPLAKNPAAVAPEPSFTYKDPRAWTGDDSDQSSPFSQPLPGLPLQHASDQSNSPSSALPRFIRPLPATMGPEDVEYLRIKGALTVPEPDLRDACLRGYFQHIHPMFPLVDPYKVLSIVNDTASGNERLSLLLFHAMLFVGCTWVDVRMVRKAGFLSRKSFRKSIHRKIRLLYDADYESDRICLLQTFVLCTFWWEGPNENKDAWYWMGLALSLSRTIDLHQASPVSVQTAAEKRLRKRLWWTLVARDIISSFGLSRSPRLRDTDYDVPMLEMEDFDFQAAPEALSGAMPRTVGEQRTSAQLCILFLKLIRIFGKIFKTAYPEHGAGKTAVLYSNQQIEGTNRMPCRRNQSSINELKAYEKELYQWRQQVPEELWHCEHLLSELEEPQKPALAHRGFLAAFYHTALLTLHRPQILPSNLSAESVGTTGTASPDSSRAEVRAAARRITGIAMDFFVADMVDSLSATFISCLVPASIVHIFDLSSADYAVRSEACQQVERCKAVFQAFSDQQYAAAWSLNIINYIVSRLDRANLQRTASGNVKSTSRRDVPESPTEAAGGDMASFSVSSQVSSPSIPEDNDNFLNPVKECAEANWSIQPNPGGPATSSSSTAYDPVSASNAALPVLDMDQPLSSNFAHFLGPETMWLDFLSVPEPPDGFSWAEGNLLVGDLLS